MNEGKKWFRLLCLAMGWASVCVAAGLDGLVWDHANGNGVEDGGESGLSGVTLNLLTAESTRVVNTVVSGAGGGGCPIKVVPPAYNVKCEPVYTLKDRGAERFLEGGCFARTVGERIITSRLIEKYIQHHREEKQGAAPLDLELC